MALAALTTLPFRWRVAPDEPAAKWRTGVEAWNGETIDRLRATLAPTRGSDAALAAAHAPELWLRDETGALSRPEPPVATEDLLEWTNTSHGDAPLGARHLNRKHKAFVLFTFPPATAPARKCAPRRALNLHTSDGAPACACALRACAHQHRRTSSPTASRGSALKRCRRPGRPRTPCTAPPPSSHSQRGHSACARGWRSDVSRLGPGPSPSRRGAASFGRPKGTCKSRSYSPSGTSAAAPA